MGSAHLIVAGDATDVLNFPDNTKNVLPVE